MARLKPAPAPTDIHDLTRLVKLGVTDIIQDGRGKKPDVYIVELHYQSGLSGRGGSSDLAVGKCILKSFPTTKASEETFARELAANSRLLGSQEYKTADDAARDVPNVLGRPSPGWPRCLGWLTMPLTKLKAPGDWLDFNEPPAKPSVNVSKALLLEYMPNLIPLTPDLLDEDLVDGFVSIVKRIHSCDIIHRDVINRAVWPDVGFNNMFIQHDPKTSNKAPVILDFNFAAVLGSTKRDKFMKKDELDIVELYLAKGLAGQPVEDDIPKEVQRLLR